MPLLALLFEKAHINLSSNSFRDLECIKCFVFMYLDILSLLINLFFKSNRQKQFLLLRIISHTRNSNVTSQLDYRFGGLFCTSEVPVSICWMETLPEESPILQALDWGEFPTDSTELKSNTASKLKQIQYSSYANS